MLALEAAYLPRRERQVWNRMELQNSASVGIVVDCYFLGEVPSVRAYHFTQA